ncbi:MAG: CapA family protein [Deltaproteobacteria bacterium]|nr:CapA family protein [Deltaproteobacteria bacterium]
MNLMYRNFKVDRARAQSSHDQGTQPRQSQVNNLDQHTEKNRLLILGDVFLPEAQQIKMSLESPFVFNLEGPITKTNKGCLGKIILKADESFIRETFGLYPLAVSLANNHIMDYGEEGLEDTLRVLKQNGVSFFGAGSLTQNCHNPLVLDVHGTKTAFMGYVSETASGVFATNAAAGVMPPDLQRIKKDIAIAKSQGAVFIVVMLHWGAEEVFLPSEDDIKTAHQIVDAGADMIAGSHAHCIQAYEVYQGKHIFYGLGNFITPDLNARIISVSAEEKKFIKKQMFWNRYSLAADIGMMDQSVRIRRFYYHVKKGFAVEAPTHITRYALKAGHLTSYGKKFRISYVCGKIRRMAVDFMYHPRVPTARNFKNVFSFLSRGNR